jgi:hypothetical protein
MNSLELSGRFKKSKGSNTTPSTAIQKLHNSKTSFK